MRTFVALAALVALAGCTVGPKYRRPAVDSPPIYRNAEPSTGNTSIGDEKWWALFQDAELQKLIRTALDRNYDVRVAAARILQAQAELGITRSQQFPSIGAQAGVTGQKIPTFSFVLAELQGVFSWNIDFWGAYRNATEATRATLLGTEWNRKQVLSTVVSDVSSAYFTLRELDLELDIAKKTLASRQQSLQLTQTLERGGAIGLLDVRQAEQLVEAAAEAIPDTERQIALQEDLISTLMGENPHAIPRGMAITEQPLPPEVPPGLPSDLIERRPDIRAAEAQLMAANAQIGVARAQFFPNLPLTGAGGLASPHLGQLFTGGPTAWNFTALAAQPIFNGGRLRSNLRLAKAQEQEMLLAYQQTIQQAFRQVSDALASYGKYRDFGEHQERLTTAAADADRLSDMRYRGGAASYLEVLTSETIYFTAQLNLARVRLNERLSLVHIYNALGGGWQQ
jgi:outer membrane protein, multidrug efflux system